VFLCYVQENNFSSSSIIVENIFDWSKHLKNEYKAPHQLLSVRLRGRMYFQGLTNVQHGKNYFSRECETTQTYSVFIVESQN